MEDFNWAAPVRGRSKVKPRRSQRDACVEDTKGRAPSIPSVVRSQCGRWQIVKALHAFHLLRRNRPPRVGTRLHRGDLDAHQAVGSSYTNARGVERKYQTVEGPLPQAAPGVVWRVSCIGKTNSMWDVIVPGLLAIEEIVAIITFGIIAVAGARSGHDLPQASVCTISNILSRSGPGDLVVREFGLWIRVGFMLVRVLRLLGAHLLYAALA
mmetsp:Transcript_109221/g.308041  ORF Transcript_109221/g.308041 Transcript_109221/m.308041 type:complete len:211 (+) Transcript_109221:1300-1932(+)